MKKSFKPTIKKNNQQGFTLVEVMVALMIVAMSLTALMINIGSMLDNTAYLQQKTVAQWVALNQLELEKIANKYSNNFLKDEKEGETEMFGQQWYWKIKPEKTGNEGFQQLQVTVYKDAEKDDQIVSMVALIDRYHKVKQ